MAEKVARLQDLKREKMILLKEKMEKLKNLQKEKEKEENKDNNDNDSVTNRVGDSISSLTSSTSSSSSSSSFPPSAFSSSFTNNFNAKNILQDMETKKLLKAQEQKLKSAQKKILQKKKEMNDQKLIAIERKKKEMNDQKLIAIERKKNEMKKIQERKKLADKARRTQIEADEIALQLEQEETNSKNLKLRYVQRNVVDVCNVQSIMDYTRL